MWAVLSMFSSKPEELHEKLNGNEIHRLENIITLALHVHTGFNALSVWFKPVDVCLILLLYTLINKLQDSPNTYTIHSEYGGSRFCGLPLPKTITFTTTNRELQVPSPYYLELHALCCKVSELSGVGRYLDRVEDELEEIEA